MPYHLVTTSDVKLRHKSKKNIFLGTWCVSYSEKQSDNAKNYNYVKPNPIDRETLDEDQKKIIYFSKKLQKDVYELLNYFHKETFNHRQWNLMLGIWIHKYVSLIINRYNNLERAIKNYEISSSTFIIPKEIDLSCLDVKNFSEICSNDQWNNLLYYRLFDYIDNSIKKKIIEINFQKKISRERKSYKYFIKKVSNLIFKKKIINSKSFIKTTYLNRFDEIKLLFLFKQPPIYLEDNIEYNSTDHVARLKLKSDLLKKNKGSSFETALRAIFFEIFPNIYLESFVNLKKKLETSILPKNPEFIFTSNEFEVNEIFKLYCVNKIKKSKYYVGQHGATYGSGRYQCSQIYNLEAADKLITWGWNNNIKIKQGFLFPKLSHITNRGKKITYMVRVILPTWRTYDVFYELEKEIEEDFALVKSFNKKIRNNLQIKMHPGDGHFFDFETKSRWTSKFSDIKIIQPTIKFDKFKNDTNLFIFNYESTGFLQLLNINFPCLLILRNIDSQIDDQFKKYYEFLIEAKILHLNNESLNNHLYKIVDDVDKWWYSVNTQVNLKKFVEVFANNKNSNPQNLKRILKEI